MDHDEPTPETRSDADRTDHAPEVEVEDDVEGHRRRIFRS
ncbi:hypothetical protein GCM10009737_06080 [Nocardioides lentus]|uniref:Uncharacterized protein n=1 Tax=Nocardioides lentus TaxID=338077 RepID=A0ABN2NZB7_9ACTN